jgi:hypothetical protein
MRRCLHLTHKAFSCMENNRKSVRLVKTHKKVCGTTGWEFSLDLLMDTHSLLRSLHQQKGLLRIVLAKRIMKWWVPMKRCEISSCYAQVAITNTVGLYPAHMTIFAGTISNGASLWKREEAIQEAEGNTRPYTKNHETMMITPTDHHVHVHLWDTRGNPGIRWSRFKGGA